MKVAFALIIALQDAGAPFAREGKPVCDAFVYSEIPAARSGSSRMRRAVDLRRSGVVRPELLVGDAGAEAIAKARAEAFGI